MIEIKNIGKSILMRAQLLIENVSLEMAVPVIATTLLD